MLKRHNPFSPSFLAAARRIASFSSVREKPWYLISKTFRFLRTHEFDGNESVEVKNNFLKLNPDPSSSEIDNHIKKNFKRSWSRLF